MAHAGYLCDLEPAGESWVVALVRALQAGAEQAAQGPRAAEVARVLSALAPLSLAPRDRALLRFVVALTLRPGAMSRPDLVALKEAGFSERLVHDVVHVVACFSYMNRLADGLGVAVHESRLAWAVRLHGEAAWQAHLDWVRGVEAGD